MILTIPERIGERVRSARRDAGWSRARLSAEADVSERYLAQLEKGTANVSISVLLRILMALEITSFDLFNPNPTANSASPAPDVVGLALIGLRGAGKTTLGTELARQIGVPFVRLTAEIEEIAGIGVGEIFSLGGNEAFHRLEKDAIDRIAERYQHVILETTGGIVANEPAYNTVLTRFKTVWLKASPDDHMGRVINQGDLRPISGHNQAMDHLKSLLKTRAPAYARSDITLDTSRLNQKECVATLVELIQHL
ncbi:MAG: helix-turn-helix domain-containing protein [Rhodobacteraceae bacterium]|nr:helix-turn-helix domain-containing protein [Paracoccaceae bacterium]